MDSDEEQVAESSVYMVTTGVETDSVQVSIAAARAPEGLRKCLGFEPRSLIFREGRCLQVNDKFRQADWIWVVDPVLPITSCPNCENDEMPEEFLLCDICRRVGCPECSEEACVGCFPMYYVVCWDCHRDKVEAEYRKKQDTALEEENAARQSIMGTDWEWISKCSIDREEDKCLVVVQPDAVMKVPLFIVMNETKLIRVIRSCGIHLPDDYKIL
jgi:hypothetical protein